MNDHVLNHGCYHVWYLISNHKYILDYCVLYFLPAGTIELSHFGSLLLPRLPVLLLVRTSELDAAIVVMYGYQHSEHERHPQA